FVAKYTDPGTGLSTTNGGAVSGGGTDIDAGQGVAVSSAGGVASVYVTGYFTTSATIAGTALPPAGGQDVFVAKYTDPGTGLSTTNGGAVSGGGTGTDAGQGVAVSSTGGVASVYVTGYFQTAATVAGTALTAAGFQDLFVAKYTDSGTGLSTTNGGAVSGGGSAGSDQSNGVAVSSAGGVVSVYVTGYFTTSATIAGTALTAAGGQDVFVAKYTDAGTGLTNTNGGAVSGGGSAGSDQSNGVAVSSAGGVASVYVTGYFRTAATVAGTALTGAGGADLFVAKYTDSGTGLTSTSGGAVSGGGTGNDFGSGVAIAGQQVYVGGYITPSARFGSTTLANPAGSNTNVLTRVTDVSLTPLAPTITSFTPLSGPVGTAVTITGTNLAGATSVSFNGTAAGFVVNSATQITATVPAGATTGVLAVTTPGGTATSAASFTVISVPTISSFTPASGPTGTTVALTGTNLGSPSTVRVNGTAGTVLGTPAATATGFSFTVGAGSSTGAVTLATADGVAASTLTPVLRLQAAGGSPGDRSVFLDQVELLDASGALVSGGIANGSFETGAPAGDFSSMPTTVTPWTFGTTAALLTPASAYAPPAPPDGTAHVALFQGVGPYVEQALSLAAGTYRVRFQVAQRQCCNGGPYDLGVQVLINGVALGATLTNTSAGYVQLVSAPFSVSSAGVFTVITAPILTAVVPNPGGLGQAITLTGANLTNPTTLTINGANALANILSNSGTVLVVRVPVTAAASGNVSITTANGTATAAFTVMAPPGNALAFDGANDHVVLPSGLNTASFTFEAWVNYQDNGTWARVFDFGTTTNNWMLLGPKAGVGYTAGSVGNIFFSLKKAGVSDQTIFTSTPMPAGRWHHLAVTLATAGAVTSGTIYLDGVAIGTNPAMTLAPTVLGTLTYSWLGRSANGDPFLKGSMDEVRVWNTARTAAEVRADMLAPATAPFPAGLLFYLNMDQGTPATTSTGDNTGLTTLYDLVSAAPAALTNFTLASGNTTSNYVQSYAMVVPVVTGSTARSATGFTVNWTAPAIGTATSYLLDVSTTPDFAAPIAGSPFATTATSYALTGLNASSAYYYRVRALNSALVQPDQGTYSNVVGQTTPLPVELTAFTATLVDRAAVRLAWATASEKNSARFEVERSTDGVAFGRIGTVAAAGSSSSARRYEWLDAKLPGGAVTLYYRLRQVDLDGTFSHSPVRTVGLAGAAEGLALYPNPAPGGAATLAGLAPGTAVAVYDALGRPVASATADASGTAALVLPAGLPVGVYVVRAGTRAIRLTVE
ncbi:LamG-like jellyroll fold domain-containing protein, partial [Hymenobacter ruricola]